MEIYVVTALEAAEVEDVVVVEEPTGGMARKPACEWCGRTFTSQANVRRHQAQYCPHRQRQVEGDEPSADPDVGPSARGGDRGGAGSGDGDPFACSTCGRRFRTPVLLESHTLRHRRQHDVYESEYARLRIVRTSLDGLVRDFEMTPRVREVEFID